MQNLLLAAGLGLRSEGKKLLLPYRGAPLVHHAVQQSLLADLFTVVVTGYRADEVRAAIEDLACDTLLIVHNPDYEQGQGTSTRVGACHLREAESFFISLSDMPLIEARHYRHLARYATHAAVRPRYKGRLGHPVLLPPSFLSIIKNQDGPFAMRSLLSSYEVQAIDVEDEAYILDIDTLDEYRALVASGRPPQSPPS
ncbi:MAG: nucleotidyltransferase family protein [Sphaerochaeta sp.]|jgi:molybdenum cofactor cytidylyltransferase|uniref:nucleotidyltransferase family protein n=1 Tax=unclassified Sphaerochaeta TaxID=2637943 RepID=UPI000E97A5B4|nr:MULTISPECIES: nucleotidyltransferase family protein [unclassified Sphaerochaeta]MCK9600064.1 nucleotidyltransferase family protein [Sphaerochaeta sp.]MDX9824805.1 nucleotidyltransferase family protein [Sphaerochaeta sp.]MEA4866765.1 nucleotidyltransferase family protein [Sphaerochaeta sp.]HBO35912.1 hypothetical protein [Sphaerochaeta sp.]